MRMVGAASTYCTGGLTLSWYVVAMVVGSLAVAAGVRAMSRRAAADGTITILARREYRSDKSRTERITYAHSARQSLNPR